MKFTVKYTEYYNTHLDNFGKYKNSNQKYLCNKYGRQFTLQSTKNTYWDILNSLYVVKVHNFIIKNDTPSEKRNSKIIFNSNSKT